MHIWREVKHVFIIYFDETDLTAKYILYLKHTHKHTHQTNETHAYVPWKMTKKKLTKGFLFFPIIYPNFASSETKQLEGEI